MKARIKEFEAGKGNEQQRSRSPTVAAESPKANGSTTGSRRGSQDDTSTTPRSATSGKAKKRSASDVDGSGVSSSLAAPAMKRQRSGEANSTSTPKPDSTTTKEESPKKDGSGNSNVTLDNIIPPDMSQMMDGANFPMMPNFNPTMMNPMAMMMGMNMNGGMNGMPAMNMNGMNFMPPNFNMNMMPGMNGMNMFPNASNMGFPNQNNQMPNWNQNQNSNWNKGQHNGGGGGFNKNFNNNRPQRNFQQANKQQASVPPAGLEGVPTGPKALQSQGQTQPQNFYPPTGPAGAKFSNQQRHVGNEEDNAYMRQPVNPHRHINRNRRARQPEYREL
jgi:protein MPE1